MDDRTTGESPHELLLALAGRVDDDLLAWCRELVAVGEDVRALELLTATLAADRTALPTGERAALVGATRTARTDLDADAALAPAVDEDDTAHGFDADLPAVERLATAVGALPARQVAGLRIWVTLRVTPAGTAPGPLPHPVVLVEVPADDRRPADVLAYQLAIACARGGAGAAVEVVVADAPRPRYQRAALRAARLVHGVVAPAVAQPDRAPVETGSYELLSPGSPVHSLLSGREDTEASSVQRPVEPAAVEPAAAERDPVEPPVVESAPGAETRPADPPQPTVAWPAAGGIAVPARSPRPTPRRPSPQPDEVAVAAYRAASALPAPPAESSPVESPAESVPTPQGRAPSPIRPLRGRSFPDGTPPRPSPGRSGAVTPMPRPTPGPAPLSRRGLAPVAEPAAVRELPSAGPGGPGGPALASIVDPLSGPIDDRPADPQTRAEPTIDENDPLGVGPLPLSSPPDTGPAGPDSGPVPDSWLADWITGDWAMAPAALDDPLAAPSSGAPAGSGTSSGSGAEPAAPVREVEPPPVAPWASTRIRSAPVADSDEPRSGRRRATASRQAFPVPEEDRLEPAAQAPEPVAPEPVAPEPVAPESITAAPAAEAAPAEPLERTGFVLRPESVARLSTADRELLARLQAELDEVPRARVTRRAGIGGTTGTGPHGTGGRSPRPAPPEAS